MKTLQNDLTTIEQSKRLLELGVPKNSANHYYGKDGKLHYIDGAIPYSLLWETGCTPCWSVGRLMEIYDMCFIYPKSRSSWCVHTRVKGISYVDYILDCYKHAIADKYLDFSKLEE